MNLLSLANEPNLRTRVNASITKYGYAPEHIFDWYMCNTEPTQEAIVVSWPDDTALLTHKDKTEWYVFSEPLMPLEIVGIRIQEFLQAALRDTNIKKIVFELRSPTRKELLKSLSGSLRACAINYTLTWPVMDMEQFDPALPGGHWKHIRNARNKFYREHTVDMPDARGVQKEDLYTLVHAWRATRRASDHAYFHEYMRIIEGGFQSTFHAHAMVVDGKVAGLNAGWYVPNRNIYYAAIGLHDYSLPDLGMMIYLADLEWFKKQNMKYVDVAGGEKALTRFKNQFLPTEWYKTFVFSIVRK